MKKIFIQFGERILKHRKRLIYGALAISIGQICFFGLNGIGIENQVFAQDEGGIQAPKTQNQSLEEKATKRNDTLGFCLKLIYALLYPLLAIAGKLVDNSLVYGEVFGFDAVLWQLWNIVKNLANFTLGFFIVYKIFEYLIKGDKKVNVKKILISALIAGVGIQASWFLMAALIDVSTILAYGVGGFPISVLGSDETGKKSGENGEGNGETGKDNLEYNPYVLKTVVYMDVKDMSTFSVYYTNTTTDGKYGDVYISECYTSQYGESSGEVILGPEMIYYVDEKNQTHPTLSDRCHLYGQIYLIGSPHIPFQECGNIDECKTKQTEYKSNLGEARKRIKAGEEGDKLVNSLDEEKIDKYNEDTGKTRSSMKFEDILKGESYVGVFTSLYSSLLNTVGLMPKDTGTFGNVLSVALSLGHMIAIAIPLLVVAVIFMMRIGILWMAIALAPFIVLFTAFEDDFGKIFEKMKFLEYFKLSNLIGIIFSPAVICFAISLSTVLVRIINNINIKDIKTFDEDFLGGLVRLDIAGTFIPIGKLLIAVLGIAVTWFLVWAAAESSKLGKSSFVQSLKTLATDAIGSIPIVPIPTKEGVKSVGLKTAFGDGGLVSNLTGQIKNKWNGGKTETLEQVFNGENEAAKAAEKQFSAYKTKLTSLDISEIKKSGDWSRHIIHIGEDGKKEKVFGDFDITQRKEIIDAINDIGNEDKRVAFGESLKEITIGSDKYIFDSQDKKYKLQSGNPTPSST